MARHPVRDLVLITAVALFGLTGCITIASDELGDIAAPAPAFVPYVQHTVDPTFSFHLDGGKMISSNKAGRDANDAIMTRWRNPPESSEG